MSNILDNSTTTIPFWELIADCPLGRGATGFVFKFISKKDGKIRACKVFDKKIAQAKEKGIEKILNEIEIHSQLNHENIVKYYSRHEDIDNIYAILEYCDGGELGQSLNSINGRMSESEIKYYGHQLANGIKYLHDNDILHRDIKLSNILLTNQKSILKICDFGLAARLKNLHREKQTWCGTPNYVAPEIAAKEQYGLKVDSWSYGCVLYAMFTGIPPFEGKTADETIQNMKSKNFKYPKGISDEFKSLLLGLINWNQEERLDMNMVLNHPFFINSSIYMELKDIPQQSLVKLSSSRSSTPIQQQIKDNEAIKLPLEYCQQSPKKLGYRRIFNGIGDYESLNESSILKDSTNQHQQQQQDRMKPPLVLNHDQKKLSCKLIPSSGKLIKTQSRLVIDDEGGANSNGGGGGSGTNSSGRLITTGRKSISQSIERHQPENHSTGNTLWGIVDTEASESTYCSSKYKKIILSNSDSIILKENINPMYCSMTGGDRSVNKNCENGSKQDLHRKNSTPTAEMKNQTKSLININPEKYLLEKKYTDENTKKYNLDISRNLDCTLNTTLRTTTNSSFRVDTTKSFCSERDSTLQVKNQKLLPISTYGIKPMKFNTKHGFVEINSDGWLVIEVPKYKRIISISPNGLKVKITKTSNILPEEAIYNLIKLPPKYRKFYEYAIEVCEKIRSTIILNNKTKANDEYTRPEAEVHFEYTTLQKNIFQPRMVSSILE